MWWLLIVARRLGWVGRVDLEFAEPRSSRRPSHAHAAGGEQAGAGR